MKKYFASSDIHSFYDEWMLSLTKKNFDINNSDHIIIICGDLFDRGNQSKECFEFVKFLQDQGRLIYVRGNHEDLLDMCISDLKHGWRIHRHHVSNGTIRTIANFIGCSEYDLLCNVVSYSDLCEKTDPILEFIERTTIDYYELNDKIFVHGWVPVTCDEDRTMIVHDNWREGDWKQARWENGIEMSHFKLIVPDKTVVCGHWHTSWGHSRYHNDGDEWDGASANFYPYYDEGIIAIDGCTAYTHLVNVVVFDENGHEVK